MAKEGGGIVGRGAGYEADAGPHVDFCLLKEWKVTGEQSAHIGEGGPNSRYRIAAGEGGG